MRARLGSLYTGRMGNCFWKRARSAFSGLGHSAARGRTHSECISLYWTNCVDLVDIADVTFSVRKSYYIPASSEHCMVALLQRKHTWYHFAYPLFFSRKQLRRTLTGPLCPPVPFFTATITRVRRLSFARRSVAGTALSHCHRKIQQSDIKKECSQFGQFTEKSMTKASTTFLSSIYSNVVRCTERSDLKVFKFEA